MDTGEDFSFTHARKVFDDAGLEYQIKEGASMMWVHDGSGGVYAYYPTTHRWCPRHVRGKHYRAKSTEDFLNRFVLKSKNDTKVFEEYLKLKFNCVDKQALFDLVSYIYEAFDSDQSEYDVRGDVYKLMWEGLKSENRSS